MTAQAILDARLATLSTRIANGTGNLDELVREFAATAQARYTATGATTGDGEVLGATQTQFHQLAGSSVTIPAGCKIIYLVCSTGPVTVTGADILNLGSASKNLATGEYINLEYSGSAGHGEIIVDATSGAVDITITK